ncbi:MAG: ATP-binding protein [Anaerolineae bacterium]|jgi:signal transduction histidine kinase
MNNLFWKGMLAFLVVILVAVGTVAVLTDRLTANAFRQYALTRRGIWEGVTSLLADYYQERDSWEGIQDVLAGLRDRWPRWRGRDVAAPAPAPRMIDFRIVDAQGRVVGDTRRPPRGAVSRSDLDNGVAIEADGEVVGYLLPALRNPPDWPLDAAQAAFLFRVRRILWIGAAAAMGIALIVGGLLFRSITAPMRELTAASRAIAQGDLSARADVRGQDEVAQLASAFNEMAESLAQMERARRNQTADIAHELRTPLTVLQGTLEAMLDGVYSADRGNLTAALSQTRTLSRLIEDLRLLALADAGKLHLEKDCLDLEAFLREVVEAYQAQAKEQGIALVLEMSPNLPAVCVDRDRLAQVMGNLLSNSLHYVPQGGHIRVETKREGDEAVLSVIDDGPGVPPGDLPRVFERFWRADPARQRATGGSGLGLSIARYVVEAHRGRIWAEPTRGGGLTVRFSLPVEGEAQLEEDS